MKGANKNGGIRDYQVKDHLKDSPLVFISLGFVGHLVFGGMTRPQKKLPKRPSSSAGITEKLG